jgi:peptidoglycan/xylan/chitin deacetylase (PgdA/CDA1 family)
MMDAKPLASLSLDLDNKWSYMKTHGDPGWSSFPSYLDVLVPRVLEFLRARGLKITFFIVGQDAALPKNREALSYISEAGHEIGNHSFNHEPWLHLYSEKQIDAEIASAEEHIQAATGQRPIGFRGPGFSLSEGVLKVLKRRCYLYDASTLPTFLGPLARAYYCMTARLTEEEKRQRALLFGSPREMFRPIRPYRWRLSDGDITEIPVTTMPLLRVPFHLSYVLYLSSFSSTLAMAYFRLAIDLCRWTGTQPSVLLHPLDFLGYDDARELSFFPAMKLTSEKKIQIVSEAMTLLSAAFNVVPVHEHASEVAKSSTLPVVRPHFPKQGVRLAQVFTDQ